MTRVFLSFLALTTGTFGATLTATLKPATVNLGKSATLTLVCEGGIATTVEQTAAARNLALSFVDSTKSIDIVGGVTRESATFTYQVTPRVAGRFAVPAFKAMVGNREIRSDAIILTVLDTDGNNTPKNIAKTPPPALLRVQTTATKVYAGQVFPVSMELLAQGLRQSHLPVPQLVTEGIRFTRIRPEYRQASARSLNGILYQNVFLFETGAVAMKPGKLNLIFELDVIVMDYRQDVFGRQRNLHLTSDPITIEVLPLPTNGRPEHFTGAVGQYQMTATVEPNSAQVGDPMELRISLAGKGTLDNTPAPDPAAWQGFKTHPATSEIQYTDLRHLSSRKQFKRMIIPTDPKLTHVPALQFSYFDPATAQYVTLTSPPTPVKIAGSTPPPNPRGDPPGLNELTPADDTPAIQTIRYSPGRLAQMQPPLIARPWFLAIPGVSLLALIVAFGWRQRVKYYEAHPEAVRRHHVRRLTRNTLRQLQSDSCQKNAAEFYEGVQLILREQIGRAIDQPAAGLTANSMLAAPLNLPEEAQTALTRLLEQEEVTRFSGAIATPNVDAALNDLNCVLRALK